MGDRMRVVAVADPDREGAAARLSAVGLSANVYAVPEGLIASEREIDGFIISSPDDCHLENFRAVAALGKPVLLEKPVEGNEGNFEAFVPELLAYKAPVLVGHCMRHAPILKKAKRLIDRGEVGRVASMRFVQNCAYGDVFFRSSWARRREVIGSLFLQKASHDFDIMHMLNDESYAESVFAFSKRFYFGGDEPNDLSCPDCSKQAACPESLLNLRSMILGAPASEVLRTGRDRCVWAQEADIGDDEMCMIEFENGVHGSYIQTFYTPPNWSGRVYTVVGCEGIMNIDLGNDGRKDGGRITVVSRHGTRDDRSVYEFGYLNRIHYAGDEYLVRNFLNVIEGVEEPLSTIQGAVAAERLGLAAMRSVQSRKLEPVNLSS